MTSDYDRQKAMISTTPFDSRTFADSCTGGFVLDIGCGYGRILDQLSGLGVPCAGLDLSISQLARCHASHFGRLVRATSTSLPFADRSFGGAIALGSIDSLTLTDELSAMLSETARVLKPRSPLWLNFYTVNSVDEYQQRYGKLDRSIPFAIRTNSGLTVRHWRIREVREQLSVSGFEILTTHEVEFLTMHHGRTVAGAHIRARRLSGRT